VQEKKEDAAKARENRALAAQQAADEAAETMRNTKKE